MVYLLSIGKVVDPKVNGGSLDDILNQTSTDIILENPEESVLTGEKQQWKMFPSVNLARLFNEVVKYRNPNRPEIWKKI